MCKRREREGCDLSFCSFFLVHLNGSLRNIDASASFSYKFRKKHTARLNRVEPNTWRMIIVHCDSDKCVRAERSLRGQGSGVRE